MARKMSEILEAADKGEMMPDIKEQEFQGARTRFNDRLGVRIESGYGKIGIGSKYGLTLINPNRGMPYFQIDNEKDLADFEKSFADAVQKVRAAMAEHEKEYRAWSKARFDREMGS
jgi:hypothetical protein